MPLPFGLDRLLDRSLWRLGPAESPLEQRDPEFIRAELPRLGFLLDHYHQVEVEGLDGIPPGRALMVGNHNGGMMAPDMFALMVAHWRHEGTDVPAYGLAHDVVFRLPFMGSYMAKLGAVPAHPEHALALLARDARVLVYPGGDLDAFKPSSRRHQIVFGRRTGFIKIALRSRAPIVPIVSVGAHEGFHVLTDGAELARRTGFKRLTRMEVLPVIVGLPWGVWVGPLMYMPLPVRMRLRVLPPLAWPGLGPDAADDPAVVERCRDEVRDAMQAAMDELVAEGGFGPIARWTGGA